VLLVLCTPTFVYALTFPKPIGLVNDYANVLTDGEEKTLNGILLGIEKNTTDEITIVTENDLQGESIEMYAVGIFKEWGIGKNGRDNGVLILQIPSEYRYRIEVGYGLEGDLNDAKVGDIARECIEPNFSKQKYFDGYECTINRIKENLTPMKNNPDNDSDKTFSIMVFPIVMIVIILAGAIGLSWIAWKG